MTASCVGASIAVRWRAAAQKKPQKGYSPVRTVTRCVNTRVELSYPHSIIDGTAGPAELGVLGVLGVLRTTLKDGPGTADGDAERQPHLQGCRHSTCNVKPLSRAKYPRSDPECS